MPTQVTSDGALTTLRKVTLGDLTFRVPATPTIRYMFWMRDFLKRLTDGELTDEDVFDCYDQTVLFLRKYNKDVDEEQLQENCELADIIGFYSRCFGAQDAEDDDGGDEVPPSTARGGSARPRSGSRSRSKSRS